VTEVDQFRLAAIACAGFCAVGATAAMPGTSRTMASASAILKRRGIGAARRPDPALTRADQEKVRAQRRRCRR